MPSTSGVIDYFLHPRFGLVTSSAASPSHIANPVSGRGNVLSPSTGPLSGSYGLVFAVSLHPAFAGLSVGTFPNFEDVVFELWVTHTLASGLVVITQHEQHREQNGIVLWEELIPSAVVVDVFPGFELTLEWLIGV